MKSSSARSARAIGRMEHPADLLEVLFAASRANRAASVVVYFACKAMVATMERACELAPSQEGKDLLEAGAAFAAQCASTVQRSDQGGSE